MYYQVHRGNGPQPYYWIIVDGSDTLAKSEMLSNWRDAWTIANRVKDYPLEFTYESFQSRSDGLWRWRITGRNGEKVVSSTGKFAYRFQADRERDRVRLAARYAVVKDMT